MRSHSCLRLEGKNQLFKRAKLRNFKNVPTTLAFTHQRLNCLQQYQNVFLATSPITSEFRMVELPNYVTVLPEKRREQWKKLKVLQFVVLHIM